VTLHQPLAPQGILYLRSFFFFILFFGSTALSCRHASLFFPFFPPPRITSRHPRAVFPPPFFLSFRPLSFPPLVHAIFFLPTFTSVPTPFTSLHCFFPQRTPKLLSAFVCFPSSVGSSDFFKFSFLPSLGGARSVLRSLSLFFFSICPQFADLSFGGLIPLRFIMAP